jgi:PBP1b-binding outer membrane lipoprotein LpoB
MKKLVLFVAVIVAVSFASCKKNTQAPVEQTPAQEQVTPEAAPAADTTAADTAVVAQ